ncbi:MAG: DEAD/DEAH box helicase, partial [Pirellulales bacterium]|nr:DEAD/DEAH box helicase [Pirellulales bacterium]
MTSSQPSNNNLSRDEIAERYLDQLQYEPYPVQEEALFAWFAAEQGVLVCAPTGTGKTLIAEAALFEALHEGKRAYYTTPLIALTEQKYREMQESAVRWGFSADDVGLVTGNRRLNPDAKILVVVAEILFNRLIHRESFEFDDVSAVVMDEFHSFNDRERGIVWEFTLGLLPDHVRTLLLSATVGNSREFIQWLKRSHNRKLELVQGDERKVPLMFNWVGDMLLTEQIEQMAKGDDETRTTPSLIFCFNREECWNVAEQIKGKKILSGDQQARLTEELKGHDWSQGAGPKLRQILQRGVGVHHAGILPKYRRIVEDLFQRKLLSVATCTETLSAGINLPARSVVVPNILKGPPDKKRLLDSSTAHQIFGRAGRPQFDDRGYIFVLAHEDDVKIARWKEQYDQIPENTKDPGLMKAKKRLKKKMPKRRSNVQYWNKEQFEKLCAAAPGNLSSKGTLPWRLLAYMLDASPEVDVLRNLVGKRLMSPKYGEKAQESLENMLMTLWRAGYVTLEPEPPKRDDSIEQPPSAVEESNDSRGQPSHNVPPKSTGLFGSIKLAKGENLSDAITKALDKSQSGGDKSDRPNEPEYRPQFAHPTPELHKLLMLRGVNPLYGIFLINHMGIADRNERIQAME